MTSVDTSPIAQIPLQHQLTRAQLVEVLATMTAYTAHNTVYDLGSLSAEVLMSELTRHLRRFGVEGKPTFPCDKHYRWAEDAADKVTPLLQVGGVVSPA